MSTIGLDIARTETVNFAPVSSAAAFSFHWEAHDDFGENGGGESGFVTNDVVVFETAAVPSMSAPMFAALAALLLAAATWRLRRQASAPA